jgi:hypothetical protein
MVSDGELFPVRTPKLNRLNCEEKLNDRDKWKNKQKDTPAFTQNRNKKRIFKAMLLIFIIFVIKGKVAAVSKHRPCCLREEIPRNAEVTGGWRKLHDDETRGL